jgi:hypothetical protein
VRVYAVLGQLLQPQCNRYCRTVAEPQQAKEKA